MWDEAAAERYEALYASPKGAFALAREQRLVADVISPWHRRNQSLLEIGCGAGHFLELFYGGGFDVTGIDSSEPMLAKAKARMGCRAALRTGNAEHLPFDDGEFDYVAMVTSLECMDNPEAVLAEAFRVTTRGVVIVFLNRLSFYRLEQSCRFGLRAVRERFAGKETDPDSGEGREARRKNALRQARWFDWLQMYRMVRAASGRRPTLFRSTLFSPSFLWRGVRPFSLSWAQLLPFGAVSVVRVDLVPVCATSIVLRSPEMARPAGAQVGVASMNSYPKSEEKR
jgi:SAM-dependent methyltransferase